MIALRHAAYALPSTRRRVIDWCEATQQPEALRTALLDSGCSHFHAIDGESLLDLGGTAINSVLRESEVNPASVDALITCHTSPVNMLPMPYSLSGELRRTTGLRSALAFSVAQQQCVSPIHALRVLDSLFRQNPHWRHALVVGVDIILREDLRPIGISGFQSDAASALLVGRDGGASIRCVETYNDPAAVRGILPDGSYEPNPNYLWSLISVIRRVMRSARLGIDQVASIVPHNVNLPAWRQALDALRIPHSRLYADNFPRFGHALGSDIAINIADSRALAVDGNHLVFASGIGGCFGGFLLQTGESN